MNAPDAPAKDFASDAFAHCKFIAHNAEAEALFAEARISPERDEAFVSIASARDCKAFVELSGALRFWPRELTVDLDA